MRNLGLSVRSRQVNTEAGKVRRYQIDAHSWERLSTLIGPALEKRNMLIFKKVEHFAVKYIYTIDLDTSEQPIKDVVSDFLEKFPKNPKPAANHQTDFTPPIYNVWKKQGKSNDVSHFGNSEISFVDNLLYLYTSPLDIVVDPFAGGGSTIDICKKRYRRYFASDRKTYR